jgi:hypothetical protein
MKALIVRGGWDGHHPVESTELFVPFLRDNGYEVRIEESPAVYADPEVPPHRMAPPGSVTPAECGRRDALPRVSGIRWPVAGELQELCTEPTREAAADERRTSGGRAKRKAP